MQQKLSAASWSVQPELTAPTSLGEPRELLSVLFSSSTVGVAICDRQFRFRAVNDTLAAMNGIPAQAHLGKTIHTVLGRVSEQVLPAFRHVFSTGQPIVNFEITAALPKRTHPGHWVANYIPIRDHAGHVQEIGAIILEVTKQSAIEASLIRLLDELLRARVALTDTRPESMANRNGPQKLPQDYPLAFSSEVIEKCIAEALAISRALTSYTPSASKPLFLPMVPAMPPGRTSSHPHAKLTSAIPLQKELCHDASLSQRERETFALLASGKTNKQLADKMSISIRTVETYRARIMLKLGLHSVTELVRYAIRNGLIAR